MNDSSRDDVQFDLFRAARLARRHLLILVVACVLGIVVIAVPSLAKGRPYTDDAQVQIGTPLTVNSVTSDTDNSRPDPTRLMDAQTRRAQSDRVLALAEAALPKGHAAYTISVTSGTTSDIMDIAATSTDKSIATKAANAVVAGYVSSLQADNDAVIDATSKQLTAGIANVNSQLTTLQNTLSTTDSESLARVTTIVTPTRNALLDQRTSLQHQLDQVNLVKSVGAAGGAKVIQSAQGATASLLGFASPIALGLVLGLLIGGVAIWARERWGGRVVTAEDVAATGLAASDTLFVRSRSGSGGSSRKSRVAGDSAWQRLALTLWPLTVGGRETGPVLLLSAHASEASAETVAVRLAQQLVQMRRPVVVVDATSQGVDASAFGERFSVLRSSEAAARLGQGSSAAVLVADNGGADLGALASPDLAQALLRVSKSAAVLIIGTGLEGGPESLALAPLSDHVVLLAVKGRTRRAVLARAGAELDSVASSFAAGTRTTVAVLDRSLGRPAARTARGDVDDLDGGVGRGSSGGVLDTDESVLGSSTANPAQGEILRARG